MSKGQQVGRQEKFVHFAGRVKTKENHSSKKTVLATREETQPFWTQQVVRPEEKRKLPRSKQQQIREETHRLVSRSVRAQILFIFFHRLPESRVQDALRDLSEDWNRRTSLFV